MLCGLPARTYYEENIEKNKITRDRNIESIKAIENEIKNVGDVVISEAYNIIEKQNKFFKE